MDSTQFDAMARRLATVHSRRLALRVGAAGLVALLGETVVAPEVEGVKKKQKQKQREKKEDRRDERREDRKERREDRKNQCEANEQKCGGECISVDSCCTNDDCTGAVAGFCDNTTCEPVFQTCANADGTVEFVAAAPGNPPRSKGAVKFQVGPDPAVDDWAHLRAADFAGLLIADILKLEYSTYAEPLADTSCPTFGPYMALYTAVGANNHVLVSVPVRSPAVCNVWQTIDAVDQDWWMPTDTGFAPQNDPKTLAQIAANFPGMTIRNALTTDSQCTTALGGLRLEFGEFPGGGGTGEAVAYVSYLTVAALDGEVTFRF